MTHALGIAVVALYAAMILMLLRVRPTVISLQFTFSSASFHRVASSWAPSDLRRVRQHFLIDFPFLASYAAFGWSLASDLHGSVSAHMKYLLMAAALCDAFENMIHMTYLARTETSMPNTLALLTGTASTCKYALGLIFVAEWIAA